ncbi:unnamed protein product [Ceutorhynchus assimilis]|uniref:Kinesin-like protein n=1 Tax=Ceutorhynchus assimilis TaxID=467358 RepID=A0A9N9QRJ8_9CUCU|nr:unnamed protein product [Ceutorhynchus assimilis]
MKSKKDPTTPRRRASVSKNGGITKAARVLSRPVSTSTAPSKPPTACNIKVVVRIRPANEREQENEKFDNVVKFIDNSTLIFDPKEDEQPFFFHGVQQKSRDLLKKTKKDITFHFDRVFNNASTNLQVFDSSTKSLIDTLMEGCNCSVFAYGATGSGKTYTMIGNSRNPGITYLTMKELFQRKEDLNAEREFELMLTYIEVYNELVKDLLNPGAPLNLREDEKYGVVIRGVKGHKITNPDELFNLLEIGNKRRTQHPTDANAESSRSHALLQVYIQMTFKNTREIRRAKLSMIDLAGSERGSATGFVGARFKEGANINKSLLALGNCINSLADGQRHVPYRDSKLTRLLKDSLGGNCHTIMIANVSPASMSFDDTYNTLKYATRAKKIKSSLKRNVVNVDMHIDQYIKLVEDLQQENSTLKTENQRLKKKLEDLAQTSTSMTTCDNDCQKQIEELIREKNEIKKQLEEVLAAKAPDSVTKQPNTYLIRQNTVILGNDAGDSFKSPIKIDPKIISVFKQTICDKKELMQREYQCQSMRLGMSLRRELKADIKSRLSSLYVDTPEKEEMRRKIDEQVDRYEKKEKATSTNVDEIQQKCSVVDRELQELVDKHPELLEEFRLANLEIDALNYKYKSDLKQKELEVVFDDHKDKSSVLETMAKLLKNLFLAVGGKDGAPESIKKQYHDIVAMLNGKKSLKWHETEEPEPMLEMDPAVSSASQPVSPNEEKSRAIKRKIETDSQLSLDSTFTQSKSPKTPNCKLGSKLTVNSNTHIVAKGKTPNKRLVGYASPRRCSPRTALSPRKKVSPRSKENNVRKVIARPDTARTLPRKATVSKPREDRPRFRL